MTREAGTNANQRFVVTLSSGLPAVMVWYGADAHDR
jgi:hypothetical protein